MSHSPLPRLGITSTHCASAAPPSFVVPPAAQRGVREPTQRRARWCGSGVFLVQRLQHLRRKRRPVRYGHRGHHRRSVGLPQGGHLIRPTRFEVAQVAAEAVRGVVRVRGRPAGRLEREESLTAASRAFATRGLQDNDAVLQVLRRPDEPLLVAGLGRLESALLDLRRKADEPVFEGVAGCPGKPPLRISCRSMPFPGLICPRCALGVYSPEDALLG